MRLSELLGAEVLDEAGRSAGRVHDVRLVQDGPVLGGLVLPVPRHVLEAAGAGGSWEAGVGTASVRAALCGDTLDPS